MLYLGLGGHCVWTQIQPWNDFLQNVQILETVSKEKRESKFTPTLRFLQRHETHQCSLLNIYTTMVLSSILVFDQVYT